MEGDGRLEKGIPARLSPAEGRKFGWLVGAAFLALGGVSWWRGHDRMATVMGAVGGLLGAGGLLFPGQLGPVYRAWMGLAKAISKVTTPLVLGILYYLVLTPSGLIRRILTKNPLVHPVNSGGFWVTREAGHRQRRDMERQF